MKGMNASLELPVSPRHLVLESDPPLTDAFTGNANSVINYQLSAWWDTHGQGMVFDSSTGFVLPDTSIMAPDAAYIRETKAQQITEEDGQHFLRMCPDFVIELLSVSDSPAKTKRKMESWISNGAELGWLIDPYRKQVLVYGYGNDDARIETGPSVKGTGPVEGFTLDLNKVWRCYQPRR